MAETRLDAELARRGLARSRSAAVRLIADGLVTVEGRQARKASQPVTGDTRIEVAAGEHWVSRAAHKLIAALDGFGIAVRGRTALDVGASTGGFTQVLRERGASRVIALDVGHDQLSPVLRADEGVTVIEGVNARQLTAARLKQLTGGVAPVDLVVADLSVISLTQVLPALVDTVGAHPDWVLLVKPQFEVGRGGVREGIVRNAALRAEAIETVLWAGRDLGLRTVGVLSSPIAGSHGNHEYLVHLSVRDGSDPTEWRGRIGALTGSRGGAGANESSSSEVTR